MSEHPGPAFEDRVRALLARTAEAIPADTDLSARIRHAHAQGTRPIAADGGARPRYLLATLAAVVVVALLAGMLTFSRPSGFRLPTGGVTGASTTTPTTASPRGIVPPSCGPSDPSNPPSSVATPGGTPIDHSVAVGRHASLHGITLTLDRAYADATQTVVSYHMQTNINPPLPYTGVSLIDAQGHHYESYSGSWSIDRGGIFVFAPLPLEQLGTPQTLTFVAQQMVLPNPTQPGPGPSVDGPWQIAFSVTPVAGTSVALHNTPLTRNGLTVQPLRLDLAPAGGGIDGATGGARVVVRLSGLPPDRPLAGQLYFAAVHTVGGGGGGTSDCGGGLFMLALPNGRQILPGFVHALEQNASPSGSVDLEALFFTPIPSGVRVTLSLDRVPVQLAGAATSQQISGPWEFQLPPNA